MPDTPRQPSQKDKQAITITRIVGWGSIVFSLFTVVTVLYVFFNQ